MLKNKALTLAVCSRWPWTIRQNKHKITKQYNIERLERAKLFLLLSRAFYNSLYKICHHSTVTTKPIHLLGLMGFREEGVDQLKQSTATGGNWLARPKKSQQYIILLVSLLMVANLTQNIMYNSNNANKSWGIYAKVHEVWRYG